MYEKIYSEIPEKLMGAKDAEMSEIDTKAKKNGLLKSILREHVPKSDQKEIDDEFKKTFSLRKTQKKRFVKRRNKAGEKPKKLTSKEKAELGLKKLPKRGLKFSDYLGLNELWNGYVDDLFTLESLKVADESLRLRLCRMDFHGAFVKVTKATCPAHLGIEGLVLMETKNTLQLLGKDDVLRTVPKNGSSFSLRLGTKNGQTLVTIAGSSIRSRASERAVKKWKRRIPFEM